MKRLFGSAWAFGRVVAAGDWHRDLWMSDKRIIIIIANLLGEHVQLEVGNKIILKYQQFKKKTGLGTAEGNQCVVGRGVLTGRPLL